MMRAGRRSRAPHGPRGPDACHRRRLRCSPSSPTRRSTRSSRRRPGLGSPLLIARASPPRRRAAAQAGATARSAASTAPYLTFAAGIPSRPRSAAGVHVAPARGSTTRWRRGTRPGYLNFVEDTVDPAKFYSADQLRRGCAASRPRSTPTGLFRGNHEISAASPSRSAAPPTRSCRVGGAARFKGWSGRNRGGDARPEQPVLRVLESRTADDTLVLSVQGEIDLATVDTLASHLDQVCDRAPAVTVDLRRVAFLDCLGLRALLGLHEHGIAPGCRVGFIQGPRSFAACSR